MTQLLVDVVKILASTITAHPLECALAIVAVGIGGSLASIAVLCSRDPSAAREVKPEPLSPIDELPEERTWWP